MSKMPHSSIKPIGIALDELVNGLGIKKKLKEYDAIIYWDSIVGQQIAKISSVTRIAQGVLFVHVKTSTWRNELTLRKKEIIDKLNTVVGLNAVKDIKFH